MHDIDGDRDWIAGLDWSKYRRPHADYVGEGFFLPGVVEMFARQVCAPYPDEIDFFLANAGNTPPGRVVPAEDAFTADGFPLFSVHQRLDSLMRSHADELEVAIARADMISREEWTAIVNAGEDDWALGQGARRAIDGLAPIIARLAAEERIICHARDRNDSRRVTEIRGREWWHLDPEQAIRRIASGGLNLASPFDPDAIPDHHIFVARDGLQNAIAEAQRTEYVAIAFVEFGKWAIRRRADHYAVQVAEVTGFLIKLMDSGNYESARNEDFEYEVKIEFGVRGLGRCYERAKAAAIADGKRARFGKRRRQA